MGICVYDFSGKTVYCFSDLEGRIPFLEPGNSQNIILSHTQSVKKVIEILQGQTELNENEAIIFTGDLIDRGPHNIKLIQKMLELKGVNQNSVNNKSVLLAIGNRDLNKIRMIDEYFITYNSGENAGKPCWEGHDKNIKFWELCNDVAENFIGRKTTKYKFKFNYKQLSGPLLNTTQAGWQSFKDASNLKDIFADTLRERIIAVEEKTLGRQLHKEYAMEEFKILFHESIPENVDIVYAAIAIMSMVMGYIWNENDLPIVLREYNGLYIKYLQNAHVIGAFKAAEGKYGVASHSGIPVGEEGFMLTNTLMVPSGNSEGVTTFIEALNKLESEKNTILERFVQNTITNSPGLLVNIIALNNTRSKGTLTYDNNANRNTNKQKAIIENKNISLSDLPLREDEKVKKLIHLSICGVSSPYTTSLSPVTYMSHLKVGGPQKLRGVNLGIPDNVTSIGRIGGAKKVTFKTNAKSENVFYNIFGHQPAGYVPLVSVSNKNVRNVCLDISKAESIANANEKSLGLLVINGTDLLEGIVYTADVHEKQYLWYLKSFEDYNSELENFGKVTLNGNKGEFKTFYKPEKFLKILQQYRRNETRVNTALVVGKRRNSSITANQYLIITLGDTSNCDGFISLALYARTGADVMYILSLPKPYNPALSNSVVNPFYGLGFDYTIVDYDRVKLVQMCMTLVWNIWLENRTSNTQKIYFIYHSDQEINSYLADNGDDTSQWQFNKFFYNDINPFNTSIFSNDLNIYGYNDGMAKPKLSNVGTMKTYTNIYMDMNGSCAFYNGSNTVSTFLSENISKIKGLYVMGGTDALVNPATLHEKVKFDTYYNGSELPFDESSLQEQPQFTLANAKINRIPFATMNQLYAPEKACNMFDLLADRIHLVTNNEVAMNGTYKNKLDFFNKYYEYFGNTLDTMMVNYYTQNYIADVRLYDVMSSLVLIKDMLAATVESSHIGHTNTSKIEGSTGDFKMYNVKTYSFGNIENFEQCIAFMFNDYIKPTGKKLFYDPIYGTSLVVNNTKISDMTRCGLLKKMKEEFNKTNATGTSNPYVDILSGLGCTLQRGGRRRKDKLKMLRSYKLQELQQLARHKGIKYSGVKKEDLIRLL